MLRRPRTPAPVSSFARTCSSAASTASGGFLSAATIPAGDGGRASAELSAPGTSRLHAVLAQDPRELALLHELAVALHLDPKRHRVAALVECIGAIGGQVDFVRGANASPGGRAIIALPSTSNGQSRIVPHVETVTTARGDVDTIVTEWGVAELAGCSLRERARRMIAIAAPEHRESLGRAAFMQERQP